jgi:hypothetical protein
MAGDVVFRGNVVLTCASAGELANVRSGGVTANCASELRVELRVPVLVSLEERSTVELVFERADTLLHCSFGVSGLFGQFVDRERAVRSGQRRQNLPLRLLQAVIEEFDETADTALFGLYHTFEEYRAR